MLNLLVFSLRSVWCLERQTHRERGHAACCLGDAWPWTERSGLGICCLLRRVTPSHLKGVLLSRPSHLSFVLSASPAAHVERERGNCTPPLSFQPQRRRNSSARLLSGRYWGERQTGAPGQVHRTPLSAATVARPTSLTPHPAVSSPHCHLHRPPHSSVEVFSTFLPLAFHLTFLLPGCLVASALHFRQLPTQAVTEALSDVPFQPWNPLAGGSFCLALKMLPFHYVTCLAATYSCLLFGPLTKIQSPQEQGLCFLH